jgi:hypothetical protein
MRASYHISVSKSNNIGQYSESRECCLCNSQQRMKDDLCNELHFCLVIFFV